MGTTQYEWHRYADHLRYALSYTDAHDIIILPKNL